MRVQPFRAGRSQTAGQPPATPYLAAHTTTQAEFEETLRINLLSSFGVLRAAAKAMMRPANGGGSVVFCSSAVAKHGIANHEAIAAAKVGRFGGWMDTWAGRQVRGKVQARWYIQPA